MEWRKGKKNGGKKKKEKLDDKIEYDEEREREREREKGVGNRWRKGPSREKEPLVVELSHLKQLSLCRRCFSFFLSVSRQIFCSSAD